MGVTRTVLSSICPCIRTILSGWRASSPRCDPLRASNHVARTSMPGDWYNHANICSLDDRSTAWVDLHFRIEYISVFGNSEFPLFYRTAIYGCAKHGHRCSWNGRFLRSRIWQFCRTTGTLSFRKLRYTQSENGDLPKLSSDHPRNKCLRGYTNHLA